ncbi:MAG: hypothetical protein F9B45_15230 [Phycisphaera sp. RhM]|nr:hypothetical protein [Phycisphaera sp. RhM]
MPFMKWTLPIAAVTMLAIVFAGCDSSQIQPDDDAAPATEMEGGMDHDAMDHDEHTMHDHASHGGGETAEEIPVPEAKSDMDKMMEALASFSDEDKASAMKQHFCPVSGEMLGVMGKPEKMEVKGQTVWICCDGCKEKLLAEPDKYLAKLSE